MFGWTAPDEKKPKRPAPLYEALADHFGGDLMTCPILERKFKDHQRANLHLAIEELVGRTDDARLTGIVLTRHYDTVNLASLCRHKTARDFEPGPVEYVEVPVSLDRKLSCVKSGLYLFQRAGKPFAMLISKSADPFNPGASLEIMSAQRADSEAFLDLLEKATQQGRTYRGQVLSLETDCYRQTHVAFHALPKISREEIVLPEAVLTRIERQTVAFSRNASRLAAAGRHLKRGVLLHGPPGTGKTLSAMYLASQMPGRTVFLLTGAAIRDLETVMQMARMLAPATVILEDVDLIGTVREHQTVGANAILFELLNAMDGLAEDTDLLFVLTTNRPDVLEPALASRPGRIDQAIEVPLPDLDCRRRLLELYAKGLSLGADRIEDLLAKTEGVSAAFIRELLRKAAVFAAVESEERTGAEPLVVEDRHLDEALAELLFAGGALTRKLLGARTESPGSPAA
jgi:SpoVK/Ycf46/Vps4 family AAA+-type ATPase